MQEVPLIKLIDIGDIFLEGCCQVVEGYNVLLFTQSISPPKGWHLFFSFPQAYGRWVVFSLKIEDVAIGSISRTYNLSGST